MAQINLNSSSEGDYRLVVLNKLLLEEQNYNYAALGGMAVMALGSYLWYELLYIDSSGWLALLIGPGVGLAIQFLGKGREIAFGVMSVVLTLVSCLLGQFLINAYVIALGENQPLSYVLENNDLLKIFGIALGDIPVFAWVLIVLGSLASYFLAFRRITQEDKLRVGIVE